VNAKESSFLHSSLANAPTFPDSTSTAQRPVPFLSDAMSLLTSGSINLASLGSTAGIVAQGGASAPSLWLAGSANFGSRTATGERSGLDFTTSGISMGVDRRFGEQLVAGVGVGFARDNTDIGTDGSRSRARAYTGVAYGSYQPTAQIFVDGLIGIGSLDFKSRRYVTPIEEIASANRKGRQIFGSIATGYEYRNNGVLISPYARIDYATDRLNQVSETGAGPYALTYFQQTTPSIQGALGIRAESVHATSFGYAAPRVRAEYRHDFQGERQTSIGYADGIGGRFGLSTGAVTRNTLVVGLGSEFIYRGGWTLGVDYQFEHTSSLSRDSSQGIRFTIAKDLDGKDSPYSLIAAAVRPQRPIDIQVDAGFMFDSNVTRGKLSSDKLSDRVYSANASKSKLFEINDNVRATVNGSLGGEKFDNFYRLSHATASLQGEIVYRPSAAFEAPTFGAFAQTSAEYYQSTLRNGYRYSAGVSVRKPLTDRIEIVGTLSHNERYGKSSVFNNRFNAIRVNADYSLDSNRTIYLTGEYRRGQIVSTGQPSLENIEIADVFVQDDAYPGGQFFSYRFDGRTVLSTLGYNLGLGARHSLDLSWRRAQSTPNFRPSFATSPRSYIADQYSIVYLVRF
jgi:outer membrane autotransporter protein